MMMRRMTTATSCGNEILAKFFTDIYPNCWQAVDAPELTSKRVGDLWSYYTELL